MTAERSTEKLAVKKVMKVTTAAKDTIAKEAKKSHAKPKQPSAKEAKKSHAKPTQPTASMFGRGRTTATTKAGVQPKAPPKHPKQGESAEWVVHSHVAGIFSEDGHKRLATLVAPLDNNQASNIAQETGQQEDYGGLVLTENGKYERLNGQ